MRSLGRRCDRLIAELTLVAEHFTPTLWLPVDSYDFQERGLMKKTIRMELGGARWRLVSYCLVDDVIWSKLSCPCKSLELRGTLPREDLCQRLYCWEAARSHTVTYHHDNSYSKADCWFTPHGCFQNVAISAQEANNNLTNLEADDEFQ